ncbi:hypothetical protein NM688_g8188 [Phlebia brevispora]|uniref:Uncharacterized protein n=1 Tax=Phlebia brevispora TaxID=194682 RepID=A0ACC1RW62_9APHY|nr:hypothetical protein NM688_g8188 [Phlebia brevispora]
MANKRRLPSSERHENPPKRQAREVIVISDDDEEEESLDHILMRIQQQEESEALARQLQGQFDDRPGPSRATSSSSPHVIVPSSDEDDEALARRLAREWAEEDAVAAIAAQPLPDTSVCQPSTSSASVIVADHPRVTPNERLNEHFSLFTGNRPCTKCGAQIPSPRGYVMYSNHIPPPSLVRLLHAACPSCEINGTHCPVLSCCAEIRAIALFEALGGFDRQYLEEHLTSEMRSKEAVAAYRASHTQSVGPGGTGYGTGNYSHQYTPYSKGRRGHRGRGATQNVASQPLSVHDPAANHRDEAIARALSTITMLLPEPYAEEPQVYDMVPHSSITALLQLSKLPDLLASLLRNDSVTDWILRDNVYHAMLALLRRMADCELTLDVLIGARYEMQKSNGIEAYVWGDHNGNITWEMSNGEPVQAQPLYAYFQKLTKQCETFRAGASRMLEDTQGAQNEDASEDVEATIKGASLCGEIIAAHDDLERAMRILGKDPNAMSEHGKSPSSGKGKNKGKGPDPALAAEREYRQVHEKLAFQHVPFPQQGNDYTTYNYNRELQSTSRSTRNPKDRLHLIKELAVMATSLPTGVWVRVDEVRNDALKIMIAGPEGTPYEGGLFEFDCFLPLEYPHKPPLMHLRTTGGGTVRFNPNLYNSGKVCLSLLGTWPGRPEEQWSSKSTLLQVLVSIQSMILVELPYFNEPGYGQAKASHPGSIEYNKTASANTVRWAMIEWLKDEHRNGMWADVISSHFNIRGAKIRNWYVIASRHACTH